MLYMLRNIAKIKYIYLFLKGGLQENRFVSHQKLLGYIGLGSGLVVSWCKLYFANQQTTRVPKARKITHAKRVRVRPPYVLISATAFGCNRKLG